MTAAEASSSPAYEPLHLEWPDCLNARDLGGLPTMDGGRIRRGALIRSDRHSRLTAEGIAAVRAYGVSRIVDLRRPVECEREPSPFAGEPIYCNIPVQNPEDPDHEWLSLAEIYIAMLDLRPKLFTQAVAAVADAPPGGVVVHCAGGKDRTGLIVAMALSIAGVPAEAIAADYALTEERLRAEEVGEDALPPERREIVRRLRPTPPENMLTVLDHLAERYDGVEGYLRHGGLTPAQRDALRARLRESGT